MRSRVPTLQVDYNLDLRIPEIIGPDVNRGRVFLTPSSSAKRSEILRSFIRQNNDLVGMRDDQIDNLKVQTDYTNPDGNLSFAILEQTINGIPVYLWRGESRITSRVKSSESFTHLVPSDTERFLRTRRSRKRSSDAARHINHEVRSWETTVNAARSTDLKVTFGPSFTQRPAKSVLPAEPGIAVSGMAVTIWKDLRV